MLPKGVYRELVERLNQILTDTVILRALHKSILGKSQDQLSTSQIVNLTILTSHLTTGDWTNIL